VPRRYEIRTGTANEAGVLFKREGLRATAQAEQKGTAMTVRVLRLGTARVAEEGLRIGTVRRPPRGVPATRYAAENWYDVWYPNLAPSVELFEVALVVLCLMNRTG